MERSFRVLFACCLVMCGCTREHARRAPAKPRAKLSVPADEGRIPAASIERPAVAVPAALPWLAVGGGSEPFSNQVSLAQDVAMLTGLLDGKGLTLFASGPGAELAVNAEEPERDSPDVRRELARLFGLSGAEHTRYERANLQIDGPATSEQMLSVLGRALTSGREPLLVYVATHGEQGQRPEENALSLWGGWPLKVKEVTSLLDRTESARPTRFVVTACYGGGFAELAFVGEGEKRSVRSPQHCGLFAAPWDDEASGCDPNPDRRAQESYSIHFLHALEGRGRADDDRMREIDLDGDGRVNLLEAHTFARTSARSFDVPTTTSERFLRSAVAKAERVRLDPLAAPEEVLVVRALGQALELDDEDSAREKLRELDRILEEARALVDEAERTADDAYYALRIALLERFPLLEHPWEARTQELITKNDGAIMRLLMESELAMANAQAARELDAAIGQEDAVRVERARVVRLVRAFETLRLASALKRRGGAAHRHFEALRACERWVPTLRRH